jgi:predicted N-acetyltransferase YhbS
MNLFIRPEIPEDVPAIHTLTVTAFLNALHTNHNEQFIVDALRAAGVLSISLVAEEGGTVVGHIAVSLVSMKVEFFNVSESCRSWSPAYHDTCTALALPGLVQSNDEGLKLL